MVLLLGLDSSQVGQKLFELVLVFIFTTLIAESKTGLSDPGEKVTNFSFPDVCDTRCAKMFLKLDNYKKNLLWGQHELASWVYNTNLTDANLQKIVEQQKLSAKWTSKARKYSERVNSANLTKLEARHLKFIKKTFIMEKQDAETLFETKGQMSLIFGKAAGILKNGERLSGANLNRFFSKNKDYDLLTEAWKLWRDKAGRPLRKHFQKMVSVQNNIARKHNFSDYGYSLWINDVEDAKFNEKVMDMYHELLPLYKELHAYTRFKLNTKYPNRFDPKGPIPAHILGNPYAQTWQNIFDILKPYPAATSIDTTREMRRQNWTVMRMFKTAEEFFTSLGLPKMTKKFWERSMLEKPNRPVDCYATAWDFSTGDDFRIKMCTEVNQYNLQTVHHEMGHIIYYMLYAHLPAVFRDGANSGFHEAVGDTISLAVDSTRHQIQLGLLKSDFLQTKKTEINALMLMALNKVAFLPFGLIVDSWRWRIYNGTIKTSEYNKRWWQLRRQLQGVVSPVPRSEEDFDAGAKYHVANDISYVRYFMSSIMEFQFYEAMCKASGHKCELHTCDFYQSKAAGDLMRAGLSLGWLKPWPQVMKLMTGQSEISTSSLVRYFSPLYEWMRAYRRIHKYPIGW